FSDVKDSPRVRMTLPGLLPIGYRLNMSVVLRRKNGGRTEEFRACGEFRVVSSALDVTGPSRQILSVEAVHVSPCWKAVKNTGKGLRPLPAAKNPKTVIR